MVFRISFSMHVSESQFNRCCPIVLRRSLFVSFSLETERPSMQFVTFMHIKKPPSSISTLWNTDFKFSETDFLYNAGRVSQLSSEAMQCLRIEIRACIH